MQLLVGPYALSGMNKIVSGRSLMVGSCAALESDHRIWQGFPSRKLAVTTAPAGVSTLARPGHVRHDRRRTGQSRPLSMRPQAASALAGPGDVVRQGGPLGFE